MKRNTTTRNRLPLIGLSMLAALAACSTGSEQTPPQTTTSQEKAVDTTSGTAKTVRQSLPASVRVSIDKLSRTASNVRIRTAAGRVSKIIGDNLSRGTTPEASADAFARVHADVLQVPTQELALGTADGTSGSSIPLMYDPQTGKYRYTLVRKHQESGGIPVFQSRMDTLHRNETGYPTVMVNAATRDMAGFAPGFRGQPVAAADKEEMLKQIESNVDLKNKARLATTASLQNFSKPSLTVWAGVDDAAVPPRLAVLYFADNFGNAEKKEKYLIVQDAETGDVLYKESAIVFEDIAGNVSGNATLSDGAPNCDIAQSAVFPYAQASIVGGNSAYANAEGSFVIANNGTAQVTVQSKNQGRYFIVHDTLSSREETLSQSVLPPGPADFFHNAANGDEFVSAQANAYVHANQVRDFILTYHPTYPTIATQVNFPVYVNLTGGYCPGNAWYDGSSMNFCASSSTYPNTSFASVNHHEYGHHVVEMGGSGQDAYGEGMADAIAVLMVDDPGLAYGFFGDCAVPLRNADNDCQYLAGGCSTCGSEVHDCGNLLSGAIWSIRNALATTNPDTYLAILTPLTINSILLHSGSTITSDIVEDFLVLDDNDGNIGNGSPHRMEICAGFEAHGLECPPLTIGLDVTPSEGFDAAGENGGPFVPENSIYTLYNMGPGRLDYTVATDVSWITLSSTEGSLALGETNDITVTINSAANVLADGAYTGMLIFTNVTDHVGDRSIAVRLTVGSPQPQVVWNMDEDPNWTADAGWEYGTPSGGGTDPSSAATGTNIYGYNLSGNYTDNLSVRNLTTGAVDCSELTAVTLRYKRWLGVETRAYDSAEVSVSTDGVNFTSVWQNPYSTLIESAWSSQEIDISTIADGRPTVYLRWTLGPTDSSVVYGGWNIDDVEIWAFAAEAAVCAVDAECDDGLFCNGQEICDDGVCADGTAVNCDDGISCTVDSCHETDDLCVNVSDDALCNNGLFCDGIEVCGDTGCEAGVPVNCDDSVDCTADNCDENADACQYAGDDTVCDDGVFCNGPESCSAIGCESSAAPACDDGIACTADSCDETLGACVNSPDDSYCDNGLFCDGEETCDAASGCIDHADPCNGTCDENQDICIACEDTTYEAETMYHSTGGSVIDGWNIWSNGYASTTHDFEGGEVEMTVVARGDYAGGAWPHMVVQVGGTAVFNTYVNTATYSSVPVSFTVTAGVKEIRIVFDNDYYRAPADRNLIVDKIIIHCTGTAATCDDNIQNGDETDEDCGGPVCDGCDLGLHCNLNTDCLSDYCAAGVCAEPPVGGVTANLTVTNDWGQGYCANLNVSNQGASATRTWTITLNTNGGSIYTTWNGNFSGASGNVTVTPVSWNGVIGSGQTINSTGFCVNRNGSSGVATVTSATGTY